MRFETKMFNDTTICAISTPPGIGGIAVVRISGQKAISIVDHIFLKPNYQKLVNQKAGTLHFGHIIMGDEILDEVVVSLFRKPHSFTGEDIVEISCHGSQYIQQELIRLLIDHGCVMAQPGEFTQRAFLNGKMDLTQAEAVADIIASQSKAAHQIAMNQMRGGISDELHALRDQLLHFTSLLELELDFADHEDLEFADRTEMLNLVRTISNHIAKLTDTFRQGNAIKNGVPIAIIGPTNAGKSTLLNMLVGEERAIVSDIHGTTRDIIEDTLTYKGQLYRFIDTAGIRKTTDEIEHIGIERSYKAARTAQIILIVVDGSQPIEINDILDQTQGKERLIVVNKSDKTDIVQRQTLDQQLSELTHIHISAKQSEGKEQLLDMIAQLANIQPQSDSPIISNMRHYEALMKAQEALVHVDEGLRNQLSGELVSLDLHDCLDALAEITGEISSQDVLNSVFSKFCIGK